MNPVLSEIGLRLRTLRARRNHTQHSLAVEFEQLRLPVTRQMLANYEAGRSDVPDRFIPVIAFVLGVSVTALLPPLADEDVRKLARRTLLIERHGSLHRLCRNRRTRETRHSGSLGKII